MKIIQILIKKKVLPVNSEVLVHLKNSESHDVLIFTKISIYTCTVKKNMP